MNDTAGLEPGLEWFRQLLDTAPEVYFRYTLTPARRFVYLSPSVHALTGHRPDEFYADPSLCLSLVPREDRRVLRQILRARRGLHLTLRVIRGGTALNVELRTVAVTASCQVVAIEGVARVASSAARRVDDVQADLPTQQRLAALMYEVHDLLHRVFPRPEAASPRANRVVRVGSLVFDVDGFRVTENGVPVALTSRETLVLRFFLTRPGQVVTRPQLLEDVWGLNYTGDDRTVDVHISRLRKKLPSLRGRLKAIKHVGYRLDVEQGAVALKIG